MSDSGEIDYRLVYDELRARLRSAMVHAKSEKSRMAFEWILQNLCNPKRLYLDALKRKATLDLFTQNNVDRWGRYFFCEDALQTELFG